MELSDTRIPIYPIYWGNSYLLGTPPPSYIVSSSSACGRPAAEQRAKEERQQTDGAPHLCLEIVTVLF